MLALALAFLATHTLSQALLGFRDLVTLTALAVLAGPIMSAFAIVGLAGIALVLACLVSLVCPSFRARRGIAGFYALYQPIIDQIIAPLHAWSWLGGSWATARAATCLSADKNHPKDPAPPAPTPPFVRFCQSATNRSGPRNTRKSQVYRSN